MKHFTRPKQWSALRKLFSLPLLWNIKFLTEIEIYRKVLTFAYKNEMLLEEALGRQEMVRSVQMLFLIPNRNIFARKYPKWERLLAVLREHIIFNVKWVEVGKMSEVFCVKLYCKMSDLFSLFLLVLRLAVRKSEINKKLKNSLYARNSFFKKWIPNKRFCIIYILVQISFFGGLL